MLMEMLADLIRVVVSTDGKTFPNFGPQLSWLASEFRLRREFGSLRVLLMLSLFFLFFFLSLCLSISPSLFPHCGVFGGSLFLMLGCVG
jgi:hypothetical protein